MILPPRTPQPPSSRHRNSERGPHVPGRKPGRPRVPEEKKKKYQSVNIRDEQYAKLAAAAERLRRPVTHLIYDLVAYLLAHETDFLVRDELLQRITVPLTGEEELEDF